MVLKVKARLSTDLSHLRVNKGPTTVPVNNVSKGDVLAQTINGALNISAQVANPSQNIVYIIRAY